MNPNNLDNTVEEATELSTLCDRLSQLEDQMRQVRQTIQRIAHKPDFQRPRAEASQSASPDTALPGENGRMLAGLGSFTSSRGARMSALTMRPAVTHGRPRPLRPWRD
jgi:hypothetical protein